MTESETHNLKHKNNKMMIPHSLFCLDENWPRTWLARFACRFIPRQEDLARRTKKRPVAKILFILLLLIRPIFAWCGDDSPPIHEDTMLMFVGEDIDVLTIASRREESAWQAPAVADVIARKELWANGSDTLAKVLEKVPGFHMAQKEWGFQPYLRGIPNSVLFLYDTIPLGSDITKTLNPIGHDLSLAAVKRVEIVRGPGSVLWGPDAFAGIVNVVPLTGKDVDGFETCARYGVPGNRTEGYVNAGYDGGRWDAFFSAGARQEETDKNETNLVRFWGDGETPVLPDDRIGKDDPGPSQYIESFGRFAYGDWLTISGRLSDSKKPYTITRNDGKLAWGETRDIDTGYVKLEAKKTLDFNSAIRFTGAFNTLNTNFRIVDIDIGQREKSSYAELIFDRSFLTGSGLFTGGTSYREKRIRNAPVWDSYVPDYLSQKDGFLPIVAETDYDSELVSVFGQYNHKFGNINAWIGARYDDHNEYRDHMSYNSGLSWNPVSEWIVKLLYGTAYRTPFARQLRQDENPEPEKIKSLSMQIAWESGPNLGIQVCGYMNRIENHVMEDPYAGLSLPNGQDIQGLEIEGHFSPFNHLDFSANFTLQDNSGPEETYLFNDYSYFNDGKEEKHFVDLRYPFDAGPSRMLNLNGVWRPSNRFTAFAGMNYFSSRRLIQPRGESFKTVPGVILFEASATFHDALFKDLDLSVSLRNLTDNDYETPGTYRLIEGEPFSAEISIRKTW